jgi:hypothetical protein
MMVAAKPDPSVGDSYQPQSATSHCRHPEVQAKRASKDDGLGVGPLILRGPRSAWPPQDDGHCSGSPISQATKLFAIGLIGLTAFGLLGPRSEVFSAEPARFSIVIQGRKVDPAQETIRVIQGAALELEFTADETVELHLHGYDQHLIVQPGSVAVMRLDANIAGRFAVEGHRFGSGAGGGRSRHRVVLYLEVHPR